MRADPSTVFTLWLSMIAALWSEVATHAFSLGAMQGATQLAPYAFEAKPPKVVEDCRPRREVRGEIAPGAAGAHDVENGVEDASQRMGTRSASCRQGREIALDAGPFSVSQVAWVSRAHTPEHTALRQRLALPHTLLYYSAT